MTKRYFITNTLHTPLPYGFINSTNKKTIEFIHCRLEYKNSLPGNVSLHSNHILEDGYLNQFVSWCNDNTSPHRLKWSIDSNNYHTMELHFRVNGVDPLDVKDGEFVAQFLLTW